MKSKSFGFTFPASPVNGALLFVVVALIFGATVYTYDQHLSSRIAASSYQAQNLKTLKAVQPNDLVLCVIPGKDPSTRIVKHAIIVVKNDGNSIDGSWINLRSIVFYRGRYYDGFFDCEIRTLRPSETKAANYILASIILYGLNPQSPAN